MFILHVLGSPELRDSEGRSVQSVVAQPKRFGLLVYLLLSRGYCRRDALLPLFWPELDAERARAALRQTVYLLRRSLGNEVIVGRGDDELAIGEEALWCDAEEFRRAACEGRHEAALELYRGDLLPAFFVSGLGDFEWWVEERRTELRARAAESAVELARSAEASGAPADAIRWWRRALSLAPMDEAVLRELLCALHRSGDRAGAVQAYDDFARTLEQAYSLEPSGETLALVARIRGEEAGPACEEPVVARAALASRESPGIAPRVPSAAARPDPGRRAGRGWRLLVAGVACSMAAGVALARLPDLLGESPRGEPVTVAVLPIEDLSADSAARFLGAGMTEELISTLGRVPGLSVTSRTTAYALRGANLRVRELGRQLGVDYVVEGSVQRAGDRVRLSVRLVETDRGRQRWSGSYDHAVADVLSVRDAVGERVAREIEGRLSPGASRADPPPTRSPEAYHHYLRGRFLLGSRVVGAESAAEVEQALRHFNAAIRADPAFASAHAALANAYVLMAAYADPKLVLPLARDAAREAIRLDERNAESHLALANIRLTYEWDWAGAEREYRRALELAPELPDAHYAYSRFLRASRRFDEALRHTERGVGLERRAATDTLAFAVRSGERLANALLYARRYDDAAREAARVLDLDPTSTSARATLALASRLRGDAAAAVAILEETRDQYGERSPALWRLADAYAADGRDDEAREILRLLLERSETQYVPKYQIGVIYLALGDTAQALSWFETAARERPGWWVTNFNASPRYEPLRADPRFRRLLEAMRAPA